MEDREAPKKKKAKRKEDQGLNDKEEGKKKRPRRCVKKRSLRKCTCELSEEREETEAEREVKIRRKLKS